MNKNELHQILALHQQWLRDPTKGKRANLRGANLAEANLYGANLYGANLAEANLAEANLRGADLAEAKLPHFQICPAKDDFIAYKKVRDGIVLELLVTGKRTSSLVGRKCRASAVKVLRAFGSRRRKFESLHDRDFCYVVGKKVSEPKYDDDIRVECTRGIHFFMTRAEAEEYT